MLAALKPDRKARGVVPDCPAALAISLDDASKIGPPTGGLMGSGFLINVNAGTLYPYDATALDDFSRVALWTRPTATTPTLDDVNPKTSRILDGAVLRQSSWDVAMGARPADPVSAVLMADQVLNYLRARSRDRFGHRLDRDDADQAELCERGRRHRASALAIRVEL